MENREITYFAVPSLLAIGDKSIIPSLVWALHAPSCELIVIAIALHRNRGKIMVSRVSCIAVRKSKSFCRDVYVYCSALGSS